MQLLVVKLLGLLGLSALMLAGILVPVRLLLADSEKAGRYHRGLALGNCFGGGVFLATCFNALLPAVRDKLRLQEVVTLQVSSDYPLAETMMMVGFFITLFVEQAVLTFRKEKPSFIALETFNAGGSEPGSDSEYDAPFLGGGHRHGHFGPGQLAGAGPLRLAGLVLALSAHSLFEGVALVTLKPTDPEQATGVGASLNYLQMLGILNNKPQKVPSSGNVCNTPVNNSFITGIRTPQNHLNNQCFLCA
uniref:Zinc transporter ZIP3 n=1 Tax=Xiphophorus couchianus TaxID=32473 RepID=A0A3B5LFP2_9TELE